MSHRFVSDRARIIIVSLFSLAAAASCIAPPFPRELALQHIPTLIALILLARLPTSRPALVLTLTFLGLHVIGARWIYSYVPYDRVINLTRRFHWRRNHYDRLVHFGYGALMTQPARELLVRRFRVPERLATYFAVELIAATSMVYELFEWGVALVLSPDDAEQYNGQQGDAWDAQKDMAMALAGSIVAALALSAWSKGARPAAQPAAPPPARPA